jgi:protein involved in polysaccharide export with SLBB domain
MQISFYRRRVLHVASALLLGAPIGCQKPSEIISLTGTPFDPSIEHDYTLYPADVLLIRYPDEPALDQELPIRTDGKISLPHVGDVQAAGRSPESLREDLNRAYAGIFKEPDVSVIVKEEAGRRVYLGGQLKRPGAVPMYPNLSLVQAIFESGGFNDEAFPGQVLVMRSGGEQDRKLFVLQADVDQIFAGEQPDVPLMPADIVHVPKSKIARLNQFVDQYINKMVPRMFNFSMTHEVGTSRTQIVDNTANFTPAQITR